MKALKTYYPIAALLLFALMLLQGDILSFIAWWATLLGLGIVFFPLACQIFGRFQSRGYIFSKVLGIAIGGYLTWMVSSLKILPFAWWAVYLVLAICLAGNILLDRKNRAYSKAFSDSSFMRRVVLEEALLMGLLACWSYLRGLNPDIIGLEKFMDFGFVNSALRSEFFPPADMWYAGKAINYYYLGQYYTAYLTRLSFLDSAVTYNLMMATLFAVVFMEAFSIGQFLLEIYSQNAPHAKVAKHSRLVAGILSGALVCLSGSLHTFIYAWLNIGNGGPYGFYWFPDATRYIGYNPVVPDDGTIHEFPLYSFVVSDLHAHVLNMLFVLAVVGAAIAVGVGIMRKFRPEAIEDAAEAAAQDVDPALNLAPKPSHGIREFIPEAGYFLAIFLIGLFPATNFWDFPIYIVVSGAIYLYANLKAHNFSFKSLVVTLAQIVVTGIVSYLVVLPFQMSFDTISSEIELVTKGSKFYQLLVLYGYQVTFFVLLLLEAYHIYKHPIVVSTKGKRQRRKLNKVETLAPQLDTLSISASDAQDKSPGLFKFLEKVNPADAMASILFICAIGLIILPEIIYVKDIYPNNPRANTMFKLCYQAFIMLGLGIGYTYPRLFLQHGKKGTRYGATVVLASFLVFCAFIYPFYAIRGWYGDMGLSNYKGLNGTAYLTTYSEKMGEPIDGVASTEFSPDEEPVNYMADDVPIVEYLNKLKGQPVICEANHLSYTSYGRISSTTGLPDIFNWYTHQQLWRNSNTDEFYERTSDIDMIYTGTDRDNTISILKKYNVEYLVIGKLEHRKYDDTVRNYGSPLNEELLLGLGEVVVEQNGSYLIKLDI